MSFLDPEYDSDGEAIAFTILLLVLVFRSGDLWQMIDHVSRAGVTKAQSTNARGTRLTSESR